MNVLPLLTIIIVIPAIAFFLANKKKNDNRLSKNDNRHKELNYLYEYQFFLLSVLQIKNQLLTRLAAINYDNVPYETFFTPFEITILKKQIIASMEELEEMIIKQAISAEDFQFKTDQLRKRIDLVLLPLSEIQHKLGNDYDETNIVA